MSIIIIIVFLVHICRRERRIEFGKVCTIMEVDFRFAMGIYANGVL